MARAIVAALALLAGVAGAAYAKGTADKPYATKADVLALEKAVARMGEEIAALKATTIVLIEVMKAR